MGTLGQRYDDERALVEAHKSGDPDAFPAMVRSFYGPLLTHARRRLGDAAAEDAVQETLLRAYRALPRFNGEYRLGAWLHRILGNVCSDEGNRRQRLGELFRKASSSFEEEVPAVDIDLSDTPDIDISGALASLPRTYREALFLRYVEELSYRDVAAKTGISEENARARVHRARSALRRIVTGAAVAMAAAVAALRKAQRPAAAAEAALAPAVQSGQAGFGLKAASLALAVAAPVAGLVVGSNHGARGAEGGAADDGDRTIAVAPADIAPVEAEVPVEETAAPTADAAPAAPPVTAPALPMPAPRPAAKPCVPVPWELTAMGLVGEEKRARLDLSGNAALKGAREALDSRLTVVVSMPTEDSPGSEPRMVGSAVVADRGRVRLFGVKLTKAYEDEAGRRVSVFEGTYRLEGWSDPAEPAEGTMLAELRADPSSGAVDAVVRLNSTRC
jgi:RNA polymerase sigma-70 factor, ECF subfamily